MAWTKAQEAAINSPEAESGLDSQTLLVAAAAGSGKTAVLVERIIKHLKDMQKKMSVQDLMVVTFTKAAAAEMSARIGAKLAEEYNKTNMAIQDYEKSFSVGKMDQVKNDAGSNQSALSLEELKALSTHLEQQLNLLPSAHISTLHSFCQWVIRSYFYKLDMDPSFRIANEGEIGLIQADVLDELFLEGYKTNAYHILDLADMFSDVRSDDALQEQVLQLYNFAIAQDNPERWLTSIKETYEMAKHEPLLDTIWGKAAWEDMERLVRTATKAFEYITTAYDHSIPIDEKNKKKHKSWLDKWKDIIASLEKILPNLHDAVASNNWDNAHDAVVPLLGFKYADLPGNSKPCCEADINLKMKTLYSTIREDIMKGKIAVGPFVLSEEEFKNQIETQYPYIEGLVDLTLAFIERFRAAKRAEGLIDFSDLEHLCLELLTESIDDKGVRQPSEVALELQKTFREVMVDEYQDTNGVQEAIVNLVSRKDNRFYVGDIKQSIYRFRMADPDLFRQKYETFTAGDEGIKAVERRIDLAKNFRSHSNILKFTNFLFSQVMAKEGAELDYREAERLDPGRQIVLDEADLPENWVGGPVEIHLIDVPKGKSEDEDTSSSGTNSNSSANGASSDENSKSADLNSDEGDGTEELANEEKEWQLIIEKIKELKDPENKDMNAPQKLVQDSDGTFRPLQWKDIVILMRSISGRANRFVAMLQKAGIPAYAEENGGYFAAMEVQLVFSLLQVIDNPEQDLPMAAVLRSFMVDMSANDIGRLRLSGEGSLWSLLPSFAEKENSEALLSFIERFSYWRTLSRRHSVSELIWQIYEDTHMVNYVSSLQNGLVRRANVLALYDRAKQYEAGNFKGLFRFLRFLENLQASGSDLALAKVNSEADDVVRIMSIHKSKGLEFPVVFLSGVQKQFNNRDLSQTVLLHKTSGLGMKVYDAEFRTLFHSIPWLYQKQILEEAAKAEEERVLYVALTRAKDKLYITGFIQDFEKKVKEKYSKALVESDTAFTKELILSANCYLDWILYSVMRHPKGREAMFNCLQGETESAMSVLNIMDYDCEIHFPAPYAAENYSTADEIQVDNTTLQTLETIRDLQPLTDIPLEENLVKRLTYVYPHQGAVETPAKISVSEIKRRFAEIEEEAEAIDKVGIKSGLNDSETKEVPNEINKEKEILDDLDSHELVGQVLRNAFTAKPAHLEAEDTKATGARFGTLMHEAMQWLPNKEYNLQTLQASLDALVLEGHLLEEERKRLNESALLSFFQSDLGERMRKAEDLGARLEHELPFSMLFDANRVYTHIKGEEKVFLQGIIDIAFIEDGEWVLIDYKTDYVNSADELVQKYHIQLDLYKEALEKLTGFPVKESYIYSFRLKEAIILTA